jgi:diguanylate cyclase (GGDEF)-like protein/PAS domain S-box-containing protein
MNWQYTPYMLPLFATMAVSATIALYAWRRRPAPGAAPFALLMVALAWWSLGYALEMGSADLSTKVLWTNIQYLGVLAVPATWLALVLQYSGRGKWLTRRTLALLAIEPLVTLLLIWTNDLHGLFRSGVRLDTSGPFPALNATFEVWFWVNVAYSYLLLLLGTVLLAWAFIRSPRLYRGQAGAMLTGALLPWVGNAVYLSGLSPFPYLDLTPFAFTFTGLAVGWGLFRSQLLNLVPIACDAVVKGMQDGVIVLDAHDRIVNLNPAAEQIIGRTASGAIGQSAAQVFAQWPELAERYRDVTEVREEITIGEGKAQHCYDLRISPLYDRHKRLTGRLIVVRDITDRRRAEENLHQTISELQAISQAFPDLYFWLDPDGTLVDYRAGRQSDLYVLPEEFLGKRVQDVLPPNVGHQIYEAVLETLRTGSLVDVEYSLPMPTGEQFFEVRLLPLAEKQLFAIVRDITTRKRAEEALRESEARYQDLYHNAPDLYDSLGPDGTILDINETGAHMLGYTREELIGRHVSQILAPEFHDRLREEFARSQERREPFEMEVPYRRKDGSTLWCHLRTEWMRDEFGHVLYSRGVARDITERKAAEEALRESEQKFRSIVEQSLDGIVLIDQQGLIVEWNRGQERIVGLKQAEVIGRPAWDVQAQVVPEERKTDEWYKQTKTSMQQFLKTGQAPWLNQLQEINIQHPDGTSRTIQQLSFPIQTDKGFMLGSIVRDVTEQKSVLEEARLRTRRQAALVQLSADLAATLDAEEICHRVVQGLHDTLGYAYQGIFLVDETTGERVLRASMGWPDAPANWRIPPGQGVTERAILDGQLHYTPDVTRDPDYVPGLGSGAEVDVPISVGGKVIGVLAVESREPHAFSPEDLEVIEAAANQAGIALSNARLLEVARRRAREAETLRQAGAVVAATLQQDEAIRHILQQLEQVVPYDSASVQLLREGYLEIVGGRGWADPAAVVGLRFPVPADNPNTVVIQERRPHILGDAPATYAPFLEEPHSHIRSWLGVPLIVGDRVIGMLTVDSTQPDHFTANHARLATAFADQVAIALENARLFEAERKRSEELEALRQAGLRLTSRLELQPVLEAILHHTLGLVAATDVHIFLYDGERLTFGAALWANGRQQTPYAEPRSDGLTYTVARSGERIVIPDAGSHPLYRDWPWGGAIVGLPLRMGDQVRGVMNVAFDRPHTFDEEELRLLELLADQAAIALENARLFEAEQHRRKVAAALLEITQVAGSSLELKQILKHIARLTAEACRTDRCSIFLLDDAEEYLEPVMSQFADGHAEPEMWQRFKATTADQVDAVPLFRDAIRKRRPALMDNPARTDLVPHWWTKPFGIQKLLLVPLISHERVIGMMALDYTDADREFTPEQIELAQTIGGQVAVSIENAQLYARTQQLAITDSLTGLYNRRGFFELGRREVERARRFGRPLTAIMFDLDHFKRVNDAYGHPIGDQVLAGLAECCRHELREVDLLGRYGGEEFTVLLPESGLTTARPVAERLRRRVERAAIDTDRGPMTITISLGIAMLDENCADLEALLERADQALYAAKQTGRNRVCVWGKNDE